MKANTITRRPTVEQFRRWRDGGMADFASGIGPAHNTRAAHCRVCGAALAAGVGLSYVEFMSDGYRFSYRYVCVSCEKDSRP